MESFKAIQPGLTFVSMMMVSPRIVAEFFKKKVQGGRNVRRCQLSFKLICKDIYSFIEKYEESQSAILFLL